METNEVVERIRSLLARYSEDEEIVRRLVATDASFDALCNEYCKVIELLDGSHHLVVARALKTRNPSVQD